MNTKLLKKHPLKAIKNHDGSDLFIVKYHLAIIGYNTHQEAQKNRFEYLKTRYA